MIEAKDQPTSIEEAGMQAMVGDRIIIRGHRAGEPDRDAEVLGVLGEAGGPPYKVRWGDSGHEVLFFPGTDAYVQHFEHTN
jgi:Domain of unknown function (DUF1918)